MTTATELFPRARDVLSAHREDHAPADEGFQWPCPEHGNRAPDRFDVVADGNDRTALHIAEEDGAGARLPFAELSDRVAKWPCSCGAAAGNRVPVMLGDQAELWEAAPTAVEPRAVVIPATPLLGPADPRDRVKRGRARHMPVRTACTADFADMPRDCTRAAVGGAPAGRQPYEDAYAGSADFTQDGPTLTGEPLNPEVVEQARRSRGVTVRDGFGQTETVPEPDVPWVTASRTRIAVCAGRQA